MNDNALNVLIVEDDLSFSIELEMLIQKIGYNVIARIDNAEEALDFIYQKLPDLVLMDIDLKGKMSGLELGQKIAHLNIPIIYITSFADEKHYKAAQESKMIAYLTKPINGFSLRVSIETAVRNTFFKNELEESDNFLAKNYLFFRKKGIYYKIYIQDISYVQSSDNYCEVYTIQAEHFIVRSSISKMSELLPKEEFMRIHRQYIIQLSQIESVDLTNNQLNIQSVMLPISRSNKKLLEQAMQKVN
ncbi:MAG: response regulator transcription factor [Bacteroidota bacterium]